MSLNPYTQLYLKSSKLIKQLCIIGLARILVNRGESHPEQRGHGSARESRGERCEDRKGFPRWGKSLSFVGTYLYPGLTTCVSFYYFPFT